MASASQAVSATEGQIPNAAPVAGGEIRIRQLDVGQGDAALITTPDARRILIDAGPDADAVAELLRKEGVDTIDLVIASHNHADHVGGLPKVFFAFVVRTYVENGVPHTTAIYRRTLEAVEREPGLRYLEATDRTIAIGSVTLRILASPHIDLSQNNNSVGAIIEYGQFRALFFPTNSWDPRLHPIGSGRLSVVFVFFHSLTSIRTSNGQNRGKT